MVFQRIQLAVNEVDSTELYLAELATTWTGSGAGDGKVSNTAARSSNLPAVGEISDLCVRTLRAVGSGEIVGWLVIVNTKETTGFTETPTSDVNGADVAQEVAVDPVTVVVADDDALAVSGDACLLVEERHFNLLVVECHAEVGVHLNLTTVAHNRQ